MASQDPGPEGNLTGRPAPPRRERIGPLRKGWTTGACAAAAARAAYEALLTGHFPDPVAIVLPRGQRPEFPLARRELARGRATAGIIKDAGDDPDVTHGALVLSSVEPGEPGSFVTFRAGEGVGTVTRAGLQLPPGEPAINPAPRDMIRRAVRDAADHCGGSGDVVVTVSIPGGEALAAKTLNARLGIVGGLSILGTTGVVVPYSCSSWIHSIHRGIDVARAAGLEHVAASTGSTSEAAVKAMYGLDDMALIDMGDFVGGTLKYLRRHPVPRLTVAGGFGKLAKLAAGHLDLHSDRSAVDIAALAALLCDLGAPPALSQPARAAASAGEVLQLAAAAGLPLAGLVAARARAVALAALAGGIAVDVAVFDRQGRLIGHAP
ncbi:MAG: cobalt-precorrin-5B (C(1))-methyltransferase [Pseudomonadota bacterium]